MKLKFDTQCLPLILISWQIYNVHGVNMKLKQTVMLSPHTRKMLSLAPLTHQSS